MRNCFKPNKATIIKKESMPLFLQQLRSQKATKDYWEECEKARSIFSASEIEKMKKCVIAKTTELKK